jgi:hypothetical protein
LAALAVAWISFAVPASAAPAAVRTIVTVSATTPMAIHDHCQTEPTTEAGSVTFHRTITEGTLTITYHIEGGPTDLNSDPAAGENHQAQFADGEADVTVQVNPAVTATTTDATVTVVAGEVYGVGDPDSGVIALNRDAEVCPTETSVAPTQDTLARTGVKPTTAPLTLTGVLMVALGAALLVGAARRRSAA